jgi:hypothetical protein
MRTPGGWRSPTFGLGIFEFLPFLSLRGAERRGNLMGLANGYGIASSAFGLPATTKGAFFKGLGLAVSHRTVEKTDSWKGWKP